MSSDRFGNSAPDRPFMPVGEGLAYSHLCINCPRKFGSKTGGSHRLGMWFCPVCTQAKAERIAARKVAA